MNSLLKQVLTLYLSNIGTISSFLLAIFCLRIFIDYYVLSEVVPLENKALVFICFYSFSFMVETLYICTLIKYLNHKHSNNPKSVFYCLVYENTSYINLFCSIIISVTLSVVGAIAFVLPGIFILSRLSFVYFFYRSK